MVQLNVPNPLFGCVTTSFATQVIHWILEQAPKCSRGHKLASCGLFPSWKHAGLTGTMTCNRYLYYTLFAIGSCKCEKFPHENPYFQLLLKFKRCGRLVFAFPRGSTQLEVGGGPPFRCPVLLPPARTSLL